MPRTSGIDLPWISIAAGLGALAVALGAFGAHALKERLVSADLAIFETAVRYQFYHALALLMVLPVKRWTASSDASTGSRWADRAGWAFLVGIALFSGSLYLLVATGVCKLGIITPFGGAAFIAGWLLLAVASWRQR